MIFQEVYCHPAPPTVPGKVFCRNFWTDICIIDINFSSFKETSPLIQDGKQVYLTYFKKKTPKELIIKNYNQQTPLKKSGSMLHLKMSPYVLEARSIWSVSPLGEIRKQLWLGSRWECTAVRACLTVYLCRGVCRA